MNKEQEAIRLLELLDEHGINYTLNHEGIGFPTTEDHEKAKKIAEDHGLTL